MLIQCTHKGWFGMCPVYIADPEGETPFIEPRFPLTGWLIEFGAFMYRSIGRVAELMVPEWEWTGFPLTITGRLARPVLVEADDEIEED